MKRLNHSGSNGDAYLASLLRQLMCMSLPIVRLTILTTPFTLSSGAQVGVASLTVNFLVAQGVGINASKASQLFSFCQITFTVGRYAPSVEEDDPYITFFLFFLQIRWSVDTQLCRPRFITLLLRCRL